MQRLVLPTILTVIAFNTASAGPLNLNPSDLPAAGASAFATTSPNSAAMTLPMPALLA